jgi:hypothetical protein
MSESRSRLEAVLVFVAGVGVAELSIFDSFYQIA